MQFGYHYYMTNISDKEYISVMQLAKAMGVSREAVLKRIKKGQIPAKRIGRAYAISNDFLQGVIQEIDSSVLSEEKRLEIKGAVKRVVSEYADTLKLLGKE